MKTKRKGLKRIGCIGSLWGSIFGYLLGFSFCIGRYLDKDIVAEQVGWSRAALMAIPLGLLIGRCYDGLWRLMQERGTARTPVRSPQDGKAFLFYAVTLFAAWIPVWLAYYPGLFAYDVDGQLKQTLDHQLSTHHPLAHTLLLQFFYHVGGLIGNYNAGMACYAVFQMMILASAIAYMQLFLLRMRINRTLRIALLIFHAVFPVNSVLAISMTKDIIFAAFLLLCFCCLCYFVLDPQLQEKKRFVALFAVSFIGMALFRNNAIYAEALAVITGIFYLKDREKKRFAKAGILCLLAAALCLAGAKHLLHAKAGSPNEMLSVPYQQIAHVSYFHQTQLSKEETEAMTELIPNAAHYQLHCADAVKASARGWQYPKRFLALYGKLLQRYPLDYAESFLHLTMGYWYIPDRSNAEIYGSGLENRQGYLLTDTKPGFGITHTSYFPLLENVYEWLFSQNEYQNIPVFSLLFSLAVYFWIVVFSAFIIRQSRGSREMVPVLFLAGYILTVFAGPCALVRYAYPFMICAAPLLVLTAQTAAHAGQDERVTLSS